MSKTIVNKIGQQSVNNQVNNNMKEEVNTMNNLTTTTNLKAITNNNGFEIVQLYAERPYKGPKVQVELKGVKATPVRPQAGYYNTKLSDAYRGQSFALSFTALSAVSQAAQSHWAAQNYSVALLQEVANHRDEHMSTQMQAATKMAYKAALNGAKKLSLHIRTLNANYTQLLQMLLTNGVDVEIIEASTLDVYNIESVADIKTHPLRQCLSILVHQSQVDNVRRYFLNVLGKAESEAYAKARKALSEVSSVIKLREIEDVYTRALTSMKYAAQNVLDAVNASGAFNFDITSIDQLIGTPAYEKMLIDVRMFGPAYGLNVLTYETDFNRVMVHGLKPVELPRRMQNASKESIAEYEMYAIQRQLEVQESLKRPGYAGPTKADFYEYDEYENDHPLSQHEWNAYYGQIAKANSIPNIAEVLNAYTQIIYFYETDKYGFLESGYGLCPHCGCPVRYNEADTTSLDAELHHYELYLTEVTCQHCDKTSDTAYVINDPSTVLDRTGVLPEVAMDQESVEGGLR